MERRPAFWRAGSFLNFTPVVRGHQRIKHRVAPEVSELDYTAAVQIEGFVVPGLTSRATETTIEIGNGQTIAIAGLMKEEVRGLASRVPGIGDVPIIGALFRSVNFQRSLSELVILVTPELVAPLDGHQPISLPMEERQDPDDFELYMLGLLEGTRTADAADLTEAGPGDDQVARRTIPSQPDELSLHGPWGHARVTDLRSP